MSCNQQFITPQSLAIYLLASALSSSALVAQTNRGGVSGNVTDQSGGVVANAKVTITSVGTGETRKLTTSDKGSFIQENLDPVEYRLEIEAPGFEKAIVEKVKVDTATVTTANIVLQTGSINTQVTVAANSLQVNTESGTLGQTITGRELNDLPLQNRSVLDLAVTIPNITGDVGSEDPGVTSGVPVPGYNLNTNGGRSGSTNMLADGISNTGVGLAREAVAFSPETVQEFTVQSNGFSAEYGRSGGGIINITTKSGTNQYSGLALWYLRNPTLNAAPFTQATTNRPTNNLRWNQFDGQFGGPVIIPKLYNGRNKTFFFFAGEPRYQSDHLQATANLPTAAMLNGDFSNLTQINGGGTSGGAGWVPTSVVSQFPASSYNSNSTAIYNHYTQVGNQFVVAPKLANGQYPAFPNNMIPASMLDPVAVKLINTYLPKPNTSYFLDSNGFIDNYVTYRYVSDDETRYNLRVDQNLGDRNHVNFRLTKVPEVGTKGFDRNYPVDGAGATYSDSQQYVFGDTFTISPTVVNELRLGYTRGDFSGSLPPQYDIYSGQNLSTQFGLPSITKGGIPQFAFDLDSFGAIGSQGSTQNTDLEENYEVADNVYVTRGSMTWKFGVDLSRALVNTLNFYAADGGNYSFRYVQTDATGGSGTTLGGIGVASFLLGVPNSVTLANGLVPYYYRWNSGAAFLQNDWKVRPNLTVNLGVRYSLQLPRTEKFNHQGVFEPSLAKTVNLPSPYTLPTGQVITSAQEIPFAFDGFGGRSPYLTPIKWLDLEPRLGFAWTPFPSHDLWNWVVRGGYGLSHVPLTGNNRQPLPNLAAGTSNFGETSGQVNPNYVLRLSSNPPYAPNTPTNTLLGLTNNPSGLIYDQAVGLAANVLTSENSVPYVQNWSFSLQKQVKRTLFEVAYIGSKGTHLWMSNVNINNPPSSYSLALQNLNVNPTSAVADPLNRVTSSGSAYRPTYLSLASPYLGYGAITTLYDASANSIFNAGYVSVRHQSGGGLTLYGNYRYGKSIDDASDANPDKGALTVSNLGGGQYSYGGTAAGDRSVSTYDIKHQFNAVGIYDLPFGDRRKSGANAWYPARFLFGGWTLSGVERLGSGYPAAVNLADGNFISGATHGLRPDIVSGVPLINPLYTSSCPTTASCQPYLNPAAFERPPAGQLGDAPRTLDAVRGPWQQSLDLSVQKSWNVGERRRIQFRVDFINAFNHPVFRNGVNSGGGTDIFGSAPTFSYTSATLQTLYNSWAAANHQPLYSTAAGHANEQILEGFVFGAQNANNGISLPANYFTVPLPEGFALDSANQFNILDPNGFKLYNLRNTYTTGFGAIGNQPTNPARYIQLGLKIYF